MKTDGKPSDHWNPKLYDSKHSFVSELATPLVGLLAPTAGQTILDVGCGTGKLTASIAESGATTIGIDSSKSMIDAAREQFPGLDFRVADAEEFELDEPVDAVFSNAALHWLSRPNEAISCIARAIKPEGLFVVEFGGKGNVEGVCEAIQHAAKSLGFEIPHPWYFPGIAQFGALLEFCNIEIIQAAMIDRPTLLSGDDGFRSWIRMFGQHWLKKLPIDCHDEFLSLAESHGRKRLLTKNGWVADYRRIRVVARKEEAV